MGICFVSHQEPRSPKEKETARYFKKTGKSPHHFDSEGYIGGLDLRDLRINAQLLKLLKGLNRLKTISLQGSSINDRDLESICKLITIEVLDLRSCEKITSKGFRQLKSLERLTNLDVYETTFDDAALVAIAGLKELEDLSLAETKITDAGIHFLKHFPQLTQIDLELLPQLTDNALKGLVSLKKLRCLDLRESPFTDSALIHLQELKSLERLYLAQTKVAGSGLQYLRGLSKLEYLDVHETAVGDEALVHIGRLRGLKDLGLCGTQVTDRGMKHLKRLSKLRTLSLEETQVTVEGKKTLKQALPKCVIFISASGSSKANKGSERAFDTTYFRSHPPDCISGFRTKIVKAAPDTTFRLTCRCGCKHGAVLGHPLSKFNLKYKGEEVVGPLGFQCSRCRKITEVIDTEIHGYDGEMGDSCTIRGTGRRQKFACPKCGENEFELSVRFSSSSADLVEDDPDIKVENFFDSFWANGKCAGCDSEASVATFELA